MKGITDAKELITSVMEEIRKEKEPVSRILVTEILVNVSGVDLRLFKNSSQSSGRQLACKGN